MIELDPIYVDVAVRRWQALTGKTAFLENSDTTFDEIESAFVTPLEVEA